MDISREGEDSAGGATDPVEPSVQDHQAPNIAPPEPAPAHPTTSTVELASGCKDSYCDAPTRPVGDKTAPPPCCEGKPSPCCDVSCLDRLALRACGDGKQEVKSDKSSESKHLPIPVYKRD